jgi:hypothetical protein
MVLLFKLLNKTFMSVGIIADNKYEVGTLITARANPNLKLKIERYYQRIYYCSMVISPREKHLVYFERELMPPVQG